jgi:hypothetical protein
MSLIAKMAGHIEERGTNGKRNNLSKSVRCAILIALYDYGG